MSLGTKLVQAVQKEAAMQRPLPMQAVAEEATKSGTVTAQIDLADNDRFSHMANQVKVDVSGKKSRAPNVQATAEKFAERATYLTERLQFVETDNSGTGILRSSPQTMRGPRTEYFEAEVRDDSISLHRYQPNTDKPGREAVPFCVTDDVLGRFVDDAVGVLQGSGDKAK